VIARDAPRAQKMQFALWVAGFAAAGCFGAWQGSSDLLAALRRSAVGAPMVEFSPSSLIGLPLAILFFCLVAMALLPSRKLAKRRGTVAPVPAGATVLFAIATCCIPLAFLVVPIGRGIVSGIIQDRDYRTCPPSTDQRRPPLRWVRTRLPCP